MIRVLTVSGPQFAQINQCGILPKTEIPEQIHRELNITTIHRILNLLGADIPFLKMTAQYP